MIKSLNAILILLVFMTSCGSPHYMPKQEDVGVSPYGAHIKIYSELDYIIVGELLAVEDNKIYVLGEYSIDSVATDQVYKYKLTYAKPKNYAWSIPLSLAAAIPSGLMAAYTGTAGLITSITATISARKSVQYTQKNLRMDELYQFARFPQGLPPGLDLNSLISVETNP